MGGSILVSGIRACQFDCSDCARRYSLFVHCCSVRSQHDARLGWGCVPGGEPQSNQQPATSNAAANEQAVVLARVLERVCDVAGRRRTEVTRIPFQNAAWKAAVRNAGFQPASVK
jgi:hypothetical protein